MVDTGHIPGVDPVIGCPKEAVHCQMPKALEKFMCPATCYCEDHCSFERCKLDVPPKGCLNGLPLEPTWSWDSRQNYWVAQYQSFRKGDCFSTRKIRFM